MTEEITHLTKYNMARLIRRVRAAINRQLLEESGLRYWEVNAGTMRFEHDGLPTVDFILSSGSWIRYSDPRKVYPDYGAQSFINWYGRKLWELEHGPRKMNKHAARRLAYKTAHRAHKQSIAKTT